MLDEHEDIGRQYTLRSRLKIMNMFVRIVALLGEEGRSVQALSLIKKVAQF